MNVIYPYILLKSFQVGPFGKVSIIQGNIAAKRTLSQIRMAEVKEFPPLAVRAIVIEDRKETVSVAETVRSYVSF
jgi:23S rRNA U2552 (ribose-2'-O)-methylase RlmE/FtsJ